MHVTCSLETLDLGELLSLVISHNGKGHRPAWYLHGVELAHIASGTGYSWRVTAWLNAQHGCSTTLRAAHAQRGALQPPDDAAGSITGSRSCKYQLQVQTADCEGAGTSGQVFVQLGGTLRESEAVQLTSSGGNTGTEKASRREREAVT